MKYILVCGGVMSGVGKGIITSSIGALLQACDIEVCPIKIDPYLNIDAGTFSPYEHGEVFVLDDGGEVDLDLGNYERFLGLRLTSEHSLTTGKIYEKVITRERKGQYLGKTVQIIPHITDAIQEWIQNVSQKDLLRSDGSISKPKVCIIELGGTIGDIESMPFMEAFREFKAKHPKDFCCVLVSFVPQLFNGEQKSKPTQNSVKELKKDGPSPDLIFCRCVSVVEDGIKGKVALFGGVQPAQVISAHDVKSLYEVPLILRDQGVHCFLNDRFNLGIDESKLDKSLYCWEILTQSSQQKHNEITKIAIVGKYTRLKDDAYASIIKSLTHSALACGRRLEMVYIDASELEVDDRENKAWMSLKSVDGVIVPGGFDKRGVEGKIASVNYVRTNSVPFLGICLGFQCAVIEYSRNVIGWSDANSTEFNPSSTHPVVIDMPEHHPGDMGGTMRLGLKTTIFTSEDSLSKRLYHNVSKISERHRHRYEVNPEYVSDLEKAGLKIVAKDETQKRMEIIEIINHPFFVAIQFHPEYLSSPFKPAPLFLGFLRAASKISSTGQINGCAK